MQDKEYIRYEDLPLEARSGQRVNVEFISNVYGVDGKLVIQCNIRDITARKHAEAHLGQPGPTLRDRNSAMDGIVTVVATSTSFVQSPQPKTCLATARWRWLETVGTAAARAVPPVALQLIAAFAQTNTTSRRVGGLNHLSAQRADGHEFPIEASISRASIFGEPYLTAIIRDVTERELTEAALRKSETEMKEAQRVARVGSWTLDPKTGEVTWSAELYRMLSLDPSLPAPTYAEQQRIFTPESWARLTATVDNTLHTGEPYELELEMLLPDGTNGWMLARGEVAVDANAELTGLCGVAIDITERKRNEKELRKAEERFSKAFRSSPLAITISTNADGRYLDVNDAFLEMVKHQRRDVIGRTATELGFWVEPAHRSAMLRQLEKDGRVRGLRTQCTTIKGDIREVDVSAEVIDLDGQNCVLAITRDITESQRLEAQFQQAQKMEAVGRLAGGIAHDFNNILGVILGYTDLALGMATANPAHKYLDQIKIASNRAVLLTRQLLAFCRQEVIFPKILDLNKVVQNVIDMLARVVGEDVTVSFRPATPIASIKADISQLEQILMNLAVNARDAMPDGGRIIIENRAR